MLNISTNRELLERLIVAELIARPGEGPLARRHFPKGGRGPASGLRSTSVLARQPMEGRPVPPPPPGARAAAAVLVAPMESVGEAEREPNGELGTNAAPEADPRDATSTRKSDPEEPG